MILSPLDITIIALYLLASLGAGVWFSRRGTRDIQAFFVSGRSLPWWLAGATMIASAFAIDTPIGITAMVADHGIPGVWYAWSFMLGGAGMLGAFIFSALLRRSGVISAAEIAELRYSGRSAALLRGFKGVYFGILANAITLGWIIRAVWVIAEQAVPDVNRGLVLAVILVVTLGYTAASGLWGIAATDCIQFVIGSAGSLMLAWFALRETGGIALLVEGLTQRYGATEAAARLRFFPQMGTPFFVTFIVFLTLKWWGNPPPAIMQRILASRDEQHASKATFFFAVIAFGFNYWPMILAALASLVLYPTLSASELRSGIGYARLVVDILPSGFLGLMLASMLAAFMSTVDTHINYGASFMINDLYRRFLVRNASASHYVRASQCATVLMLGIAVGIACHMESVAAAWLFMSMLTAGYGIVATVRWFWWRVNAWSEIATLTASLCTSLLFHRPLARALGYEHLVTTIPWGYRFLITTLIVTLVWVLVTLITPPCPMATLEAFCRRVRPFRLGWGALQHHVSDIPWSDGLGVAIARWATGSAAVMTFCFGTGSLFLARFTQGALLMGTTAVLWWTLFRVLGTQTLCPAGSTQQHEPLQENRQ